MRFDLVPHVGAGGIHFGMVRSAVRALLGQPIRSDERKDFFFSGALHVHYDSSGNVESLVVASQAGGEAILDGIDLLGVGADAALALVRKLATVDQAHPEYPMTCIFPDLDLNLWRPCLPEHGGEGDEGSRFEAVAIARPGFYQHEQ